MREIKFKVWDKEEKIIFPPATLEEIVDNIDMGLPVNITGWGCDGGNMGDRDRFVWLQYTGLKDKNGLQEVYEGDIIDTYGNIKGNTYEMDKGETDFVIQGFGDKNWGATYKEAVERGCTDTQRYASSDEVRELE